MLKNELLDLVARLSSCIFLGDEDIAKDPEWLKITKDYTVESFLAARQLRLWPRVLQPYVASWIPQVYKIQKQLARADAMITPVIERRRSEKISVERHDSIEWVEAIAKEKNIDYWPAAMQLNMALSAIHTTADLITTTMYELVQRPDDIAALRKEIIEVVGTGGLEHVSLYKLKLMDSAIKEAQRIKPVLSSKFLFYHRKKEKALDFLPWKVFARLTFRTVNMVRTATADITLDNGLSIPKGTRLGVSTHAQWDPQVYPNPEEFQVDRFVKLRERPGEENVWQLSTTRPEQIAFGHGIHACPGRFLAANEIKIMLCHLLLKFDWKISADSPPIVPVQNGIMLDSSPMVKVDVRERQPEVSLII